MHLPIVLKQALESQFAAIPLSKLAAASADLSKRYRQNSPLQDFIRSDAHRLAYLAVRMPATYAVIRHVLLEIKQRLPRFHPSNLCDIGAGPGTATWASIDAFPEISAFTLHEKDKNWLKLGNRLMQHHAALKNAEWKESDLNELSSLAPADLAILSYVIGELSSETTERLIDKMWAASQTLAIIEPGTPAGFQRIKRVRDQLIQQGAFIVAPCPHHGACPMSGNDWCHFADRLERSSIHIAVKGVSMGYEDEKFSYLVVSKTPAALPEARIVRHPQHHSGHIDFTLCTQEGIQKRILSKKQGSLYKQARKLEWGNPFLKDEIKC